MSLAERYASREDYVRRVSNAADELVRQRFVLPQDREYVIERATRLWEALAQ